MDIPAIIALEICEIFSSPPHAISCSSPKGERAGEQLQQPQLLLARAHQHDRADRSEVIETGEEHHRKLQWAQSQGLQVPPHC